jgi:DNA-directed RNA polymerase subunit beta
MTDKIVRYTKLAQRKDFSRFSTEFFDEPNLLDIVRDSYNEDILKEDLDQLFKLYFPIKHEKNSKYVVHYHGILPFVKQKDYVNEELARKNGLSYEKALFVDLRLENTITGEIISAKKGKLGVSDGVFFGNIPQLTKRLTFIINGIEKNVVAQIVRAPGLYFVPSSKFKIFAKKKLKNVCELYPGKGSMMNIFVKNDILNVLISDTFRKNTFAFTYSEMLKAFGMSEKNIIDIFGDNPIFINSLNGGNDEISNKLKDRRFDIYTRKNIFDDKMINSFRNEVKTNTKIQEHGIYNKIYELLAEYENTKNSESVSAIKIIDKIISE